MKTKFSKTKVNAYSHVDILHIHKLHVIQIRMYDSNLTLPKVVDAPAPLIQLILSQKFV